MRTVNVLLIEGARNNGNSFAVSLRRKYQLEIANSGKQGLALAQSTPPDVVVLDAASLRTSGDRICARLRSNLGETPLIHIRSADIDDGESVADVVLNQPFTARKLINRIERFVTTPDSEVLELGPFTLNVGQQTLLTPWSEKKLTPKLVALMELFLRSPNQVLERKGIMQAVWKTDYMGDTRTLDVHIRWIRQVVEPNPRKPQFITTVRGKGYRLALPDSENSPENDESPDPKAEWAESSTDSALKSFSHASTESLSV